MIGAHPLEDWRSRAACLRLDTDLFFPRDETEWDEQQVEDAKAVCRTCAVQSVCLEFALATRQKLGIWGGLTDDERRSLRRRRARRSRAS